ncbi:MAG: signal peptidase II [Candidatus Neomarinimicrobiota bacterium]
MLRRKKILLLVTVLALCIGCDQAAKEVARQTLRGYPPESFAADTFRLHYIENTGGFLSLGARLPAGIRFWLMQVLPVIGLSGIVIFTALSQRLTGLEVLLLALVAGGGIGNLIDRIFRDGRVVDFLNLGIGPLRTGIFNLADVFIMVGGIGLVALGLIVRQRAAGQNQ